MYIFKIINYDDKVAATLGRHFPPYYILVLKAIRFLFKLLLPLMQNQNAKENIFFFHFRKDRKV